MENDLISRSALLEALCNSCDGWCDNTECDMVQDIADAPAVDPLTVFKNIGLVKEAFEMAKADLMQVVQCKNCVHWETTKCPLA